MAQRGKTLPANAGDTADTGSVPGSGRSPEEGNDNPPQYSWLENMPWTDEPGELQSRCLKRVGHDWATQQWRRQGLNGNLSGWACTVRLRSTVSESYSDTEGATWSARLSPRGRAGEVSGCRGEELAESQAPGKNCCQRLCLWKGTATSSHSGVRRPLARETVWKLRSLIPKPWFPLQNFVRWSQVGLSLKTTLNLVYWNSFFYVDTFSMLQVIQVIMGFNL